MVEEAPVDTFPLTLGGREILFKKVTLGMMAAARRYMDSIMAKMVAASAANDDSEAMRLHDEYNQAILDVIDSRFVDPADQDWTVRQMMMGTISVQDLLPVMTNGTVQMTLPADDADVVKKKPAGKKAPAKKVAVKKASAAAKTANSSRVKR